MKLYAVRTIEDKSPVGFFAVFDFPGLVRAIDGYGQYDTEDCEYRAIREECGMVWEDRVDWQMGVDWPSKDPLADAALEEQIGHGLIFYGALESFVGFENIKRWRRVIRPAKAD